MLPQAAGLSGTDGPVAPFPRHGAMTPSNATAGAELALLAVALCTLVVLALGMRRSQHAAVVASAELQRSEERVRKLAQTKHELDPHNARLSDVVEITPALVTVVDVQGQLTYLNQAARELWRIPANASLTNMSMLLGYAAGSRDVIAREAF